MTTLHQSFLQLVRLGIGTSNEVAIPERIDWNELMALAAKQGLSAIVIDGLEKLPDNHRPPKELLLRWIGETLQNYEYRFEQYRRAIAEIASFYKEHHFKMMILKGYACGLDWPRPEHRPCGDIDIYLFGKQKIADEVVSKEKSIIVNNSEPHHSVFYWSDFMVENHYDFIDVNHRRSSAKLEAIFKQLAEHKTHTINVLGENVVVPSSNLHALFLVYHTMLHFTSTEMSVRQILDWAFFAKKHTKEVNWSWLIEKLNEFHLMDFFNILNTICVKYLGFKFEIFQYEHSEHEMVERVMNDTLAPEFIGKEPANLIARVWFRYRRWISHEWKHKLCYKESMWSAFWSGVWGHLLKPKSI